MEVRMTTISRWDVLDACSHSVWKFPANLASELSSSHSIHVGIGQVFVCLEILEDAKHVESREEDGRRSFRKTQDGMQAQQKNQQNKAGLGSNQGLKPA
jgi:hypothetical protein